MKNPIAEAHDENHAKKKKCRTKISDDFGLRRVKETIQDKKCYLCRSTLVSSQEPC